MLAWKFMQGSPEFMSGLLTNVCNYNRVKNKLLTTHPQIMTAVLPTSYIITFWVLIIMTGCNIPWSCDCILHQKTPILLFMTTWFMLHPHDLLNNFSDLTNDHCKNSCKIESRHMVTQLSTTTTYYKIQGWIVVLSQGLLFICISP